MNTSIPLSPLNNDPDQDGPGEPPIYEVAVAVPLHQSLSYTQPTTHSTPLAVGSLVLAPLGGRQVSGYILGPGLRPKASNHQPLRLKPITALLSSAPLFPASLLPFYRWIARYYHFPLGEVIRTALPLAPNASSGHRVLLAAGAQEEMGALAQGLDPAEQEAIRPWLEKLCATGALEASTLQGIWRKRSQQCLLRAWEKKGLIAIEPVLYQAPYKARNEERFIPQGPLAELITADLGIEKIVKGLEASLGRVVKKSECRLLRLFVAQQPREDNTSQSKGLSRSELRRLYPNYGPALKGLLAEGIFSSRHERLLRKPWVEEGPRLKIAHQLTQAQQAASAALAQAISACVFSAFLLFGVTGSGKTEVYLRAVQAARAQGKSALVLAPEIALAAQLENELRAVFGEDLALAHSGLSDGERLDQWFQVLSGQAQVVLGARSAIFAPLSNLGIIIVDEEHEAAYKQEDGLCYHARDLAVLRAKQAGCPVLLGSATPSLVSYHHAMQGKYRLLPLPERVTPQHRLPRVDIIDMAKETAVQGAGLLSGDLLTALQDNLQQGGQSLLFINRRGFSTFMQCQDCSGVLHCRHCQVSLTLHRRSNMLLCHYCGYSQSPRSLCPGCGSPRLLGRGMGSERLEEEVAALFPSAAIARIDSDTSANRRQHLALLNAVRSREIDILVGTQMIAKGLHFPHLTLVGVVWADASLSLPDYKAGERTFSLLSQVIGRAGRGEQAGRVILQSYQPNHYSLHYAREHDYLGLYTQEMAMRQPLGYPPFSRLVNIRLSSPQEIPLEKSATNIAAFLRAQPHSAKVQVLGPTPAPLAKIKDRFRWQILLKSSHGLALHQLCALLLAQKGMLWPATVKLHLDVDPENMM